MGRRGVPVGHVFRGRSDHRVIPHRADDRRLRGDDKRLNFSVISVSRSCISLWRLDVRRGTLFPGEYLTHPYPTFLNCCTPGLRAGGDSALVLAKSASDTPRISGGKAGSTSILRPFFFAAWVRITRASTLRRKTGASKSGLCRFFCRRCAGCRIDSGSAAFTVCMK